MKDIIIKKPIRVLLLFLFIPLWLSAQNISVKGIVKDAQGDPIIGVSVVEKGTTNGIVTDLEGQYTLNVSSKARLDFSYLGYITQTIDVSGRTKVDVVLQEDVRVLDQVVVIGYGTQRKEAVTGSVASIKGDAIKEMAATDVSSALYGRLAGVDMSQTSSKPGSPMQIRIRGTRSLNASNDPLIVLDGIPFPGSISDINPSDIKSIDILKDASATAIYGSRGANGVLMITTNKGQTGAKASVSYNGFVGLKTLFSKYPMMNGEEYAKLREFAGKYQNGPDESNDVNTNWQDLLYQNSMVTNHDLSILGGTEQGSYNFSLGYLRDEALIPQQNFTRYSMRGTLDQAIGKSLKFGFITNNNYSVSNGGNLGTYGTLSLTPISNPYNADGTWKRTVKMAGDEQWAYSRDAINALGDKWIDQGRAFGSYNTVYGEVKIPGVEGLKYRLNLGLNYRQNNTGSYTGEGVFSYDPNNPSTATVSNSHTTNWAVENLVTYDRTFSEKHSLNVVALYSAEETQYNKSQMSAKGIPDDAFQFYNLGQATGEITVSPANQGYYQSGLMSWMGRAMYSYDDRYMVSVAFRSDASSRLAQGNKWHTYPAVSAGWNIRKEAFMDGITWMDNLKLRVGYGQTSNESIDPYKTFGLLSTRPYNFGNEYTVGYYVSELPNQNLGWEYSETWNYGADFSFLNGRISGSAEYYVQNTKDILFRVNLPATTGVGSYMANIGKSQNKGFELTLNGTILDNHNGWSWDVGVNFYTNRNKLVGLTSRQEEDRDNWWFVGHPINVIYDYEKIGLWQEGDKYRDILEPGGNAGMIKVKYTGEFNEDGSPKRAIGDADKQVIDVNPDFQGGFNTRVAYKGFDFNVIGAFQRGGILISSLYSSTGYLNMLNGRRGNVKVDYWTPENTNAKYPKPGGITNNDNPKYGSTLGYFDATYLKIRNITLGYTFSPQLSKNLGINKLYIYSTIQNPFVLFSPYHDESGMDPETNSLGNENQAVTTVYQKRLLVIGTNTPSTRNFLIGLNLTF
ncbi:TonB-linked SusC/RagA family outer membrane protein [Dysgonomonas alginatilytica]|uniref:TonB-linked SusC/RagA family outer membrane protein n=1 Tax=Dysgonomonas alginatilytica TaxID=1605892 RepID=A0A2V3PQU2_9BACT|nr:TonB-dependent receptor [Dysgonomonas alginatilytica]PXV66334.1 TonB-linked SusC/RagA family outer membrane protein [Dysgonomonas alginatilytica]